MLLGNELPYPPNNLLTDLLENRVEFLRLTAVGKRSPGDLILS